MVINDVHHGGLEFFISNYDPQTDMTPQVLHKRSSRLNNRAEFHTNLQYSIETIESLTA